jgi:predicted small metal-binding protein
LSDIGCYCFSQLDRDKKLNTLFSVYVLAALIKLSCRETGLDCDFIIEGETEEQFLALGAEHAMKVHGLKAEEIFLKTIPCNFLCHSFGKLNDDKNT